MSEYYTYACLDCETYCDCGRNGENFYKIFPNGNPYSEKLENHRGHKLCYCAPSANMYGCALENHLRLVYHDKKKNFQEVSVEKFLRQKGKVIKKSKRHLPSWYALSFTETIPMGIPDFKGICGRIEIARQDDQFRTQICSFKLFGEMNRIRFMQRIKPYLLGILFKEEEVLKIVKGIFKKWKDKEVIKLHYNK